MAWVSRLDRWGISLGAPSTVTQPASEPVSQLEAGPGGPSRRRPSMGSRLRRRLGKRRASKAWSTRRRQQAMNYASAQAFYRGAWGVDQNPAALSVGIVSSLITQSFCNLNPKPLTPTLLISFWRDSGQLVGSVTTLSGDGQRGFAHNPEPWT